MSNFLFLGKMLASSARHWSAARLVRCSIARLFMIPLMIMCVLPRSNPIFSAEITSFAFSLILGLTNGILGGVPMIQASTKVEDRHRELTGKYMQSSDIQYCDGIQPKFYVIVYFVHYAEKICI